MNETTNGEDDEDILKKFVAIETAEELVISIKQEDVLHDDTTGHVTLQIYNDAAVEESPNEQATRVQRIQGYQGGSSRENDKWKQPTSFTLTQSDQEQCEKSDINVTEFDTGDVINIEPKEIAPMYPEDEHCYYNSTLQEEPGVHESNKSNVLILDATNDTSDKGVVEITPQGTTLLQCKVCNMCFSDRHQLNLHQVSHINNHQFKKKYPEPIKLVNANFPSDNIVDETKAAKPPNKDRALYKCTDCPSDFADITRLRGHLWQVHGKLLSVKCPECPLEFDSRTLLNNHLGQVHDQKPWQCEFCPLSFANSWHLGRHTSSEHQDSHRFRCTVCSKGFPLKHVLQRHMVVSKFLHKNPM